MPRYAILLRGVNVGKGNRVPMAEFRDMLETLGCTKVRTLLNSGNAVVTSPVKSATSLSSTVAKALVEHFDVTTPVIVKSAAQLQAIVNEAPVTPPDGDHSRFLVAFGPDEAALRALDPVMAMAKAPDRMAITAHAAYLHCAGGILESPAGEAMLGKSGRGVTTRNWATVLKLLAALDE
jgi:uncharacterized protein (DUF1697 family)